ncbi:hypothetical protein [Enterobacter sp. 276E10]|uniref:hypothetical protein n=1 Tax=Enterobacter TaxID=547 RepID=UPI002A82E562|nr:hypothetical protein [Enterobacter sp. 276E10]
MREGGGKKSWQLSQLPGHCPENEKLPFAEVSVMVSEDDEDADILAVVRERLKNPARRIRVNVDDL